MAAIKRLGSHYWIAKPLRPFSPVFSPLLISFTSNYTHGDLQHFGSLGIDDKDGMGLHLAALAALFGDVQLAARLRHRAANEAARQRDRGDAAREQATSRVRVANGCLIAQCRFLL
jgi:hypothetical protein